MVHLIVEITKYLMILLCAIYTYQCFAVFRKQDEDRQRKRFRKQSRILYLIHFMAYLVLYLVARDEKLVFLYFAQIILFVIIQNSYRLFYPKASRLVSNNMCMLLMVGFVILARIDIDKATKQFIIAAGSAALCLIIPVMIRRMKFFRRLTWLYAVIGVAGLAVVWLAGSTSYGAKISLNIAGISIQPSEFIKILFVFYVAAMFHVSTSFSQVLITSAVAAVHVLILVFSRDLGGALIFFMAYLVMLYVATKKAGYLVAGLAAGSVASVVAYQLFSHVQKRVLAWRAPLSVIDDEGYQICQSLFAIGTGGFFGMGLYQGMPKKIPKVMQDFIFSAIAEEMGLIFALCLILICVSCLLMFFNIAMQLKDSFYKLVALGLGTIYGVQVFLTIGGVTKFIPSTGVTLPLVSYGGSSVLSTLITFGIIQGLYILREDEGDARYDREKGKRSGKTEFFGEEVEDFNRE
ncbi:MAG: FtsW/RodA/SpoVE family cell cycle protein [Lachnospiraceae bacterium]|nr:FtsW/RodA/SpoVE family cell cycle protein [Lachnospiraceae bacterium]